MFHAYHFHTSDQRSCLDYILYVAQLPGLHHGSDHKDVDAKINCGDTHVTCMHYLDLVMKTSQTRHVFIVLSYELKSIGLR